MRTRWTLLSVALALPGLAPPAVAAPLPKEKPVVISVETAAKVRKVTEFDRRVDRITRGPGRGELTFLHWNQSVEVVDDVAFRGLRKYAAGHKPTDFAASPDGKLLAWTERDQKSYTVQDAAGKAIAIEPGNDPGHAAFSPDGTLLAVGSTFWEPKAEGVGHSEMKVYGVTGELVRTLDRDPTPGALTPVFSPDGMVLAVGNRNAATRLFAVATGKQLHTLDRRMTHEIAFSPDGKTLAAGYVDGTVAVWDVATGKELHAGPSGCAEVYSVAWSPKGDVLLTTGRKGPIGLWDPRTLTKVLALEGPAWVIQGRFTADGTRLLTAGTGTTAAANNRSVIVWAVRTGPEK